MSQYLFLYRGGDPSADRSPEELQQIMQKWGAWIGSLVQGGHMKEQGHPLESAGKVVRPGLAVSDGPFAEKDVVCGFTIVEAVDIDQAVELSRGCPIFDGGGAVEVRPVIDMGE